MRSFLNYNFSKKVVTAMVVDTSESIRDYLWIGFGPNGDGTCDVRKTSVNDLSQTYYDITGIDCDRVNDIIPSVSDDDYIVLAVDDATYFAYALYKTAPITSQETITYPSGVIEAPIKVFDDGTTHYFLTPGVVGAENAKVVKYNTTFPFSILEVIDLPTTYNAIDFSVVDSEIWIVTSESPSMLVRVYNDAGAWVTDILELNV